MNTKKVKLKYMYTICVLLFLFTVPVSAAPDALLDRSRTQFGDLTTSEINYINARFVEVKGDIMFIPDITSNLDFQTGAASDSYFINNGIDSLDDTTDVNIVLIHTHGGVSGSSCRLQFKDGSLLTASDVSNWLDQRDGGFFFAGACSSAKYTDLGMLSFTKDLTVTLGTEVLLIQCVTLDFMQHFLSMLV
ncbi:hypothetical protein RSJ42_07365 [Methanosarcina hadiensis]|uniref:hypothetical protein n=1 Tax=Methanosarcina hadiensis TaxID=3078083 RepID=UPI003977CD09